MQASSLSLSTILVIISCMFFQETCRASLSTLDSQQVSFEGDLMVLQGPVHLENELGKMQAGKAALKISKKQGNLQLHYALLEEDVVLHLAGQGELRCQRAEFDREKGVAVFSCPDSSEDFVVYRAAASPIELRAGEVSLRLGEGAYQVQRVEASENVEVDFGDCGVLKTSDVICLQNDRAGGLRSIQCLGTSLYSCENDQRELDVEFAVDGEIYVDHAEKTIRITRADVGSMQILFRDHMSKALADRALLRYSMDDGAFSLRHLVLKGRVRLQNREGLLMQYALSDYAAYGPSTKELCLKGGDSRVLLYDKINDLQASAPEARIRRDEKTGSMQFKGSGDVRFHLAEKEFELMRKRFIFEKNRL